MGDEENSFIGEKRLHRPGSEIKQSSDLRQQVLMCYNDIHNVWGNRENANQLSHLRSSEVEAFALDAALRKVWDLQQSSEVGPLFLSSEQTKRLRNVVLDLIDNHIRDLQKEYSFQIPDPEFLKKREEEKQQQLNANRNQRKERAEAAKKAKEDRLRKMREKRAQASNSSSNSHEILSVSAPQIVPCPAPIPSHSGSDSCLPQQESLIESSSPSTSDEKEPPNSNSEQNSNPNSQPADSSSENNPQLAEQNSPSPSPSSSDEKPESSNTKKTFVRPAGSARTLPGRKLNDRTAAAFRAFAQSKNTGSSSLPTKPHSTSSLSSSNPDEEPVPTIVTKQTLVDTEELTQIAHKRIHDEFSNLPSSSSNPIDVDDGLEFYHLSVKGPRVSNEDEYVAILHLNELLGLSPDIDRFSYFAAYDGHSGKYTSLYVRSQLHFAICKHPEFPHNIEKAIIDSFLEIDRLVNEVQERDQFSCGTTALAVCVRNREELIVGNVGDCRGYLYRDNTPVEIAVPHFPSRDDEKERIKANGGAIVWHGTWRVNGILAVSRSIGDYNLKKYVIADPDVTRFTLNPESDEFLILASDGLWDVISPEEAMSVTLETCATKGRSHVCKVLCDLALEKHSKDNVTVLVIFFRPETSNPP